MWGLGRRETGKEGKLAQVCVIKPVTVVSSGDLLSSQAVCASGGTDTVGVLSMGSPLLGQELPQGTTSLHFQVGTRVSAGLFQCPSSGVGGSARWRAGEKWFDGGGVLLGYSCWKLVATARMEGVN